MNATTSELNSRLGDVFQAQRALRARLLDRKAISEPKARDLAAHMLLAIDDLNSCWSIAASWLREELKCHRVDAGFGLANSKEYFPSFVEAKNPDYEIPSFDGGVVYNKDPAMQAMWYGVRPVVFADIKQDRRITPYLRNRISGARTKSKFGTALRANNGGYGLICADWTEHEAPNKLDLYECFEHTTHDVISPIIAVSKSLAEILRLDADSNDAKKVTADGMTDDDLLSFKKLTVSETEIARLVAQGLSYKEIARIRGRSVSTIDHQLRSIRQKTGVSSTAALVSLLAKVETFNS